MRNLSLISIAFNEDFEGETQTFSLFVEKDNSLQIIWEFILASFRFFGEPEGISKCYYAEYIRLDKFFMENSTLPMADSEIIVDIFKFCINANVNLHEFRNIEFPHANSTTDRLGTDVVMEESHMPRVSDLIGSASLADLILTPAEKQMDTWKPNSTKIIQLFQDFDNEGFDVSKILFDIVLNSKLRFMQCKEIFCLVSNTQIPLALLNGLFDLLTIIGVALNYHVGVKLQLMKFRIFSDELFCKAR